MANTTGRASLNRRLVKLIVLISVAAFVLAFSAVLGCAPSERAAETSDATEGQGSSERDDRPVNWTIESDCATCHTTEAESALDEEYSQAYAHQNETTCVDCHTDEAILTTVHEGLTYADADKVATRPTVITVAEQTCIECHGTLAEMAADTAASTTLTDDQGTAVNPHERPQGQTHEENPATCTDCHNNHSKDLGKDAMRYCTSCHHRGVFTCGTCHEIRTRNR